MKLYSGKTNTECMDHKTRHSFNSSTRVDSVSVIRERMEDREI